MPAAHVDHSVHDVSLLVPSLKCVDAHAVHVASAKLLADAVKYWPAGQLVRFAVQLVTALVPSLKCVDAHAVHVASALVDPPVKYWPAGHDDVRTSQGP